MFLLTKVPHKFNTYQEMSDSATHCLIMENHTKIKMAEEDGKGCDWSWILYLFAWSVFMGLGIFLIIFGYDELATCEHSMLPLYILVTGCTMVAGCVLSSLAGLLLHLWSLDSKSLRRHGGDCVMRLYIVLCIIWWIAGCYWTWNQGDAGCAQRVHNVALFITIAPILCVLCFLNVDLN